MVFWRKRKNAPEQDRELQEDRLVHPPGEPEIEPSTDQDELDMSPALEHELAEPENELLEDLEEIPVPRHTPGEDAREAEELRDHSEDGGWFSRLRKGLSKSSSQLGKGIGDVLTKRKLDGAALEELEDLLITADLGPKTAAKIVADFSKERFGKEATETEIKQALAAVITRILEPVARPLEIRKPEKGPFTVLVTGVNGVGKTTTIGKLAHQLHLKDHAKVMMAAGDTFRAAAIEQLEIWADRAHCPLVRRDVGADAAAVAYEAYERAEKDNSDALLIDTAGRLHNKANLMAELEKIIRVLKKRNEEAPHETLLVLDATTGQNAHAQVETFKEMLDITGLVVTKLDGSARGGVVVSLADRFGLPIYAVGVGEKVEDLQPFHPEEFARLLVGLDNGRENDQIA